LPPRSFRYAARKYFARLMAVRTPPACACYRSQSASQALAHRSDTPGSATCCPGRAAFCPVFFVAAGNEEPYLFVVAAVVFDSASFSYMDGAFSTDTLQPSTVNVTVGTTVYLTVSAQSQDVFPLAAGINMTGGLGCPSALPSGCQTLGNNLTTTCMVACTPLTAGAATLNISGVDSMGNPKSVQLVMTAASPPPAPAQGECPASSHTHASGQT
jgi:hypothetical protein